MSFVSLVGTDVEIEYDSKKYKLGALTFKEIAEYLIWYQYRELEIAKETTKGLPDDLKKDILLKTHEECKNKRWIIKDETTGEIVKETFLSYECPEIQESLNTPVGIMYQAYLALKINHPDMTLDLSNKICSLKTTADVLSKLNEAAGLVAEKIQSAGDKLPGEVNPNQ